MKGTRALALLLCVTMIVVAVALPNTALAWLRSEYRWLGQPLNWIEQQWPALDLVHVLLFALLGFVARWALPRTRMATLMLWLALFAALSELIQLWAPGRTARPSDFAQDVLGAVLGVWLAAGVQALWARQRA